MTELVAIPVRELPHWIAARVDFTDSCWLWTGHIAHTGYGSVYIPGSGKGASPGAVHRLAYEACIGSIPEGLVVDHLCRVRSCLNPAHLDLCSRGENVLRGDTLPARNRAKTRCTHGHEFTPANTWRRKDGSRQCRLCNREAGIRYRARQKDLRA